MAIPWINGVSPGRLAAMSHPRGGDWLEADLRAWKTAGAELIVSTLKREEIERLALDRERAFCDKLGLGFISFPVLDHGVPDSVRKTRHLAGRLARELKNGRSILVHCFAGLGRSPLIAACTMIHTGTPPQLAMERLSSARGFQVPETREQRHWVERFAARPRKANA